MPLDPITQTYRAFRDAMLAWQPWADLVLGTDAAKKNADFPDASDPKFIVPKEPALPRDFPQVLLLQGDFTLRPHGRNSMVASVDQAFALMMTQDAVSAVPANALKWETLRALAHAQSQSGSALNALTILSDWNIGRGTDYPFGRTQASRPRFVTALQINVALNIPRAALFT